MKSLFMILFLLSCANPFLKDNEPRKSKLSSEEQLQKKLDLYLSQSSQGLDEFGFYDHIGDSLLFTCLLNASGGSTDISQAVLPSGRPLRHPNISPEISRTSFSKDMMVGYLVCMWVMSEQKSLPLIESLIKHGRSNNWNLCGDLGAYEDKAILDGHNKLSHRIDMLSRCVMSPALIATIYDLAVKVGYNCDVSCHTARTIFIQTPTNSKGFARHLNFLHQSLRGLIEGSINDNQVSIFRNGVENQPNNALYQAIYHTYSNRDQSKALSLLLDENKFPSGAIPDNNNYCTHYLFQRDERRTKVLTADAGGCIQYKDAGIISDVKECGLSPDSQVTRYMYNPDWLPCDGGSSKAGIDFMYAATWVLGKLKGIK